MHEFSLKQKSIIDLIESVIPMKHVIKRWFHHAGMKFLQSRQLTDEQEKFLEEITDFYSDNLENIERDKSFLKKIEFEEIKFPQVKKSTHEKV